jgi:hypothetical protein
MLHCLKSEPGLHRLGSSPTGNGSAPEANRKRAISETIRSWIRLAAFLERLGFSFSY